MWIFSFQKLLNLYVYVCECKHASAGTDGIQKQVLGPLKLDSQKVVSSWFMCWKLNLRSLREQCTLITVKPFTQALNILFVLKTLTFLWSSLHNFLHCFQHLLLPPADIIVLLPFPQQLVPMWNTHCSFLLFNQNRYIANVISRTRVVFLEVQ